MEFYGVTHEFNKIQVHSAEFNGIENNLVQWNFSHIYGILINYIKWNSVHEGIQNNAIVFNRIKLN